MSNDPSFPSRAEGAFMKAFRRFTVILIPPSLLLIVVLVMAEQFTEIQDRNEILTATVVVALMSMSALSFSWVRCLPDDLLRTYGDVIHGAGIDLFIASLPALISAFLIWIKVPTPIDSIAGTLLIFTLHWIFLLMAMVYSVNALLRLLRVALEIRGLGK